MVKHAEDIEGAVSSLGGVEHGLYAERWAPFVKVCAGLLLCQDGLCMLWTQAREV